MSKTTIKEAPYLGLLSVLKARKLKLCHSTLLFNC